MKLILFLCSFILLSIEHQKISLQLNSDFSFEVAGYIAAKEKGFYQRSGLDVQLKPKKNLTHEAIKESVLKEEAEYGITDSRILLSYLKGKKLKLLSSMFKLPKTVLLVRPSIKSIEDLKGKEIMVKNEVDFKFNFQNMLKEKGIDYHEVKRIPLDFVAFIQGRADAMVVSVVDDLYKVKELGIEYHQINPQNHGFYNLEQEVFTSEHEAVKHEKRIKQFITASNQGWQYALKNKQEIIRLIMKKYSKSLSRKELNEQAKQVETLLQLDIYNLGSIKKSYLDLYAEHLSHEYKLKKHGNLKGFLFNELNLQTLTDKEIRYLNQRKTIKYCINNNWAPIEFLEKGIPKGISIDVLKIIQEKIGVKMSYVKTSSWKESQEFLRDRKCDILPILFKNEERSQFAVFTKPYLVYDLAIITKDDKPLVKNLISIIDKKISRKSGSALINLLKKKYSRIDLKESDSYYKSFLDILNDRAYYTITTLPVLSYYKNKYNLKGIQIAGFLEEKYHLRMGVRHDDLVLFGILNKKLQEIPQKTLDIIYDKWVYSDKKKSFDYVLMWQGLLVVIIIIITMLYYQVLLKKKVDSRTKELAKKNEDLKKEIQKREETEKKLIVAKELAEQSNTSKTKFLASISHELKTPMNSILSYSRIGMKRGDVAEREKLLKYFNNINISGNRLLNLLEDLLSITKIESNAMEYFFEVNNLSRLINSTILELEMLAEEKQITIHYTKKDINIIFDYKRMTQVILNILNNAIKFSPISSEITIETKITDDDVIISIEDQGPGIDKQDFNVIFNSFTQGERTKKISSEGTGLGLAISQSIVRAHGGKIWALNSKKTFGAIFFIRLPKKN